MSESNFLFDAANAFRGINLPPVTATGEVGELPLDKMTNVRNSSQRGKLGAESYRVIIKVESAAFVNVTDAGAIPPTVEESYVITLEVGEKGATNTVVGRFIPTIEGTFVVALDAQTIEKLDPNRDAIALHASVEGTDPSLAFSAWVI